MEKYIEQTLEVFEKYNPQIQFPHYDKDRYREYIKTSNSIRKLNAVINTLNLLWGVGLKNIEDELDIQK